MDKGMGTPKLLSKLTIGFLAGLAATMATVCAVTTGLSGPHHELKARAEKVFDYDERNQGRLPASKLRALSVAISFHDDSGSKTLLSELEPLSRD